MAPESSSYTADASGASWRADDEPVSRGRVDAVARRIYEVLDVRPAPPPPAAPPPMRAQRALALCLACGVPCLLALAALAVALGMG